MGPGVHAESAARQARVRLVTMRVALHAGHVGFLEMVAPHQPDLLPLISGRW